MRHRSCCQKDYGVGLGNGEVCRQKKRGCGQRGGIQAEEREEAEYPNVMAPGLFRERQRACYEKNDIEVVLSKYC